jgi:hypothetical protein
MASPGKTYHKIGDQYTKIPIALAWIIKKTGIYGYRAPFHWIISYLREINADGGIGQRRNRKAGAFFHSSLREANGRRGLFEHVTI